MRRRISRTLLAATAASVSVIGLSLMASGAAGAGTIAQGPGAINGPSGGAPIVTDTNCVQSDTPNNCARAGYQASGRDFRYAQASIVVPAHTGTGADGSMYVALDNTAFSYDYARVGIEPCTTAGSPGAFPVCAQASTSGWEAFAAVQQPGDDGGFTDYFPISVADEGLGIYVSVYLSTDALSVHTVVTTPTTTTTVAGVTTTTAGVKYNDVLYVDGGLYTAAQAVADWSGSGGAAPWPRPPVTANTSAYDQFFDGRFTTWSGIKGTFNGKWAVNPIEATTNGLAASGTSLVAGPSYLWTNDKYPGDAFGVWIYGTEPALT
jgi:hypothetical protein